MKESARYLKFTEDSDWTVFEISYFVKKSTIFSHGHKVITKIDYQTVDRTYTHSMKFEQIDMLGNSYEVIYDYPLGVFLINKQNNYFESYPTLCQHDCIQKDNSFYKNDMDRKMAHFMKQPYSLFGRFDADRLSFVLMAITNKLRETGIFTPAMVLSTIKETTRNDMLKYSNTLQYLNYF